MLRKYPTQRPLRILVRRKLLSGNDHWIISIHPIFVYSQLWFNFLTFLFSLFDPRLWFFFVHDKSLSFFFCFVCFVLCIDLSIIVFHPWRFLFFGWITTVYSHHPPIGSPFFPVFLFFFFRSTETKKKWAEHNKWVILSTAWV